MSPEQGSRLMQLPPEIRNMIYEFVLTGEHVGCGSAPVMIDSRSIQKFTRSTKKFTCRQCKLPTRMQAQLLLVSRQFRHESQVLLYSTQQFYFVNMVSAQLIATQMGDNISYLRSVELQCRVPWDDKPKFKPTISFYRMLAKAVNLEYLYFHCFLLKDFVDGIGPRGGDLSAMKPFLRAAWRRTGNKFAGLNLIHIRFMEVDPCMWRSPWTTREEDWYFQDSSGDGEASLREYLKLLVNDLLQDKRLGKRKRSTD